MSAALTLDDFSGKFSAVLSFVTPVALGSDQPSGKAGLPQAAPFGCLWLPFGMKERQSSLQASSICNEEYGMLTIPPYTFVNEDDGYAVLGCTFTDG